MATMLRRAPTLSWVLTALACFLTGALVGEGWSRAAPHPGFPTAGVVVTVKVVFEPTAAPEPTAWPTPMPTVEPSALTCDPFGAEAPRCDRTDDDR